VCSPQEGHCEKRCEIRGGGQEMVVNTKILIITIQVNFVPNPSEMWRRQHKFAWIVAIKIVAINNYKKKWNLIEKQPSCKKMCSPQENHCEERCEIQGGGQEMVVMVG